MSWQDNVDGSFLKEMGLGRDASISRVLNPKPAITSDEAIANQIRMGRLNSSQGVPDRNPVLSDPTMNSDQKIAQVQNQRRSPANKKTELKENDYIDSLKIDSIDRYNQLLNKGAFNPSNKRIMNILAGLNKPAANELDESVLIDGVSIPKEALSDYEQQNDKSIEFDGLQIPESAFESFIDSKPKSSSPGDIISQILRAKKDQNNYVGF